MSYQIIKANYLNNFLIELVFADGKINKVDFESFVNNYPAYPEYKKIENFKKFKLVEGNIVWGENWDMIFPLLDLYNNDLSNSDFKNEEMYLSVNL